MGSTKKIIVSKISRQRKAYSPREREVLIRVKNGEVDEVIRGAVKYPITHEDGSEWYCVDCKKQEYIFCYSCGNIKIAFSFVAEAAFPTFIIKQATVGKDMIEVIQSFASSPMIANMITEFLSANEITTEKQLFSGNTCERLQNTLRSECKEHFIKSWGMLLNSVTINKKRVVENENIDEFDPLFHIL